jgi:hypothetical protein
MPIFPRDYEYINHLIGKRLAPNRRRKPIPYEMRQCRIDRLRSLKGALEADDLTFDMICREHPFFSRVSKGGRQRLISILHCRAFPDVRARCLALINAELHRLMNL